MRLLILALLASIPVLTGCTTDQDQPPQKTSVPPTWLSRLPEAAQTSCDADSVLNRRETNVWELPGVEPSDPNSAHMGRRGKLLGSLPNCTEVMITGLAWSKTDQGF